MPKPAPPAATLAATPLATADTPPITRQRLSPQRRREILDTAMSVFLERGFSGTSTAEIALRAKTSKETLYKHFGTKEELFALGVQETSARIRLPLELALEGEPREVLEDFGYEFLTAVLAPETVSYYRVIVAETAQSKMELGQVFAQAGPVPTLRLLSRYLQRMTELRRLNCPTPARDAVALASLIVGQHLQQHLIGVAVPMTAPQRREWVRYAIEIFLARFGPRAD